MNHSLQVHHRPPHEGLEDRRREQNQPPATRNYLDELNSTTDWEPRRRQYVDGDGDGDGYGYGELEDRKLEKDWASSISRSEVGETAEGVSQRGPQRQQEPSKPSTYTPYGQGRFECSVCSRSFTSHRDYERHYRTVHTNQGKRQWSCTVEGCHADVLSWAAPDGLRKHKKHWHGLYSCGIRDCSRAPPNGFATIADLVQHNSLEHAQMNSMSQTTSRTMIAEPLNTSRPPQSSKAPQYNASPSSMSTYANSATTYPQLLPKYHECSTPSQEPDTTPISIPDEATIVRTNHPIEEQSNPNYRVEPSSKFRFGKVFKVLWSEPSGDPPYTNKASSLRSERIGENSESRFEKIRRFVIIDTRKGHCICLPILTYGGQGTKKRGVFPDDHAIIHTSEPTYVMGEERLAKAPIRVVPASSRHKLEPASRINYAKVYTVEYNVKVWFIGNVSEDSEWELVAAYDQVHPPLQARYPERNTQGVYPPHSSEYFTHLLPPVPQSVFLNKLSPSLQPQNLYAFRPIEASRNSSSSYPGPLQGPSYTVPPTVNPNQQQMWYPSANKMNPNADSDQIPTTYQASRGVDHGDSRYSTSTVAPAQQQEYRTNDQYHHNDDNDDDDDDDDDDYLFVG